MTPSANFRPSSSRRDRFGEAFTIPSIEARGRDMISSVLILCTGNICRSPIAAALMGALRPDLDVGSAGVGAVAGAPVDPRMARVSEARGLPWPQDHRACQFSPAQGRYHDLVLTMESEQAAEVIRWAPDLQGRVFQLTHWIGGVDIPDPYRRSDRDYDMAVAAIDAAVRSWAERLPTRGARSRGQALAPGWDET